MQKAFQTRGQQKTFFFCYLKHVIKAGLLCIYEKFKYADYTKG